MITAELIIGGCFFEYTYDTDNFSVVLGGRIDNHNRLGILLRQDCMCDTILGERSFSAGRGKRSANVFAENQQLLVVQEP
jgi:hypothetical protein